MKRTRGYVICRSNLFRYFCKEKVFFFSIKCRRRHCDYFEICINFCSVTVRTKKNYIFRSTGNNLQIQTVRCSLSKEKNFPPNFQDGPISRSRTFLQGKAFSFLTRHSEMIVRCLSSSVRHYETNDKLAPKNSMITCQYSV